MLQHVVLFRFAEPLEPADEEEMTRHVRAWADEVSAIRGLRFGTSTSQLNREQGYQYLLFMEFDDEAGLQEYMVHPAHRAFGAWLQGHPYDTLIFDYPLTGDTLLVPAPAAG